MMAVGGVQCKVVTTPSRLCSCDVSLVIVTTFMVVAAVKVTAEVLLMMT